MDVVRIQTVGDLRKLIEGISDERRIDFFFENVGAYLYHEPEMAVEFNLSGYRSPLGSE
jgi:hypothetical protein